MKSATSGVSLPDTTTGSNFNANQRARTWQFGARGGIFLTLIVLLLCATVAPAATVLPVGTRIQFDKVYATNPALSQWIEGEITGYMPAQNYYKIRATNGVNYTIANDPRWIRAVAANGAKPAAAKDAPKPPPVAPPPATPAQPPANTGSYTAGTHIQFDRVEALVPAHGRWDSGVIVERAPNNRYKIRGDNGILYAIQDDPRWILPAGAPLPGPRHDYLDKPQPAPAANANTPAPNGAMPPDGLYNVTNLGALHSVGQLEIHGATYRGLEASGAFKPLGGTGAALVFTAGLAGLEGQRITGANYMGLNKLGQPVIKIRYTSVNGFNEELEATKEH